MKVENQIRDIAKASFIPMTEEEFAQSCQKAGMHVVLHRDHYSRRYPVRLPPPLD
jgi:hypothetical protein